MHTPSYVMGQGTLEDSNTQTHMHTVHPLGLHHQQWAHLSKCAMSMSSLQTSLHVHTPHSDALKQTPLSVHCTKWSAANICALVTVSLAQLYSTRNLLVQTPADSAVMWLVKKGGKCRDFLTWNTAVRPPHVAPPSLCLSLFTLPIFVHLPFLVSPPSWKLSKALSPLTPLASELSRTPYVSLAYAFLKCSVVWTGL